MFGLLLIAALLQSPSSLANSPHFEVRKDETVLVIPSDWKLNVSEMSIDYESKTVTIGAHQSCPSTYYYYSPCGYWPCTSGSWTLPNGSWVLPWSNGSGTVVPNGTINDGTIPDMFPSGTRSN